MAAATAEAVTAAVVTVSSWQRQNCGSEGWQRAAVGWRQRGAAPGGGGNRQRTAVGGKVARRRHQGEDRSQVKVRAREKEREKSMKK
jgi:hypothetical protein